MDLDFLWAGFHTQASLKPGSIKIVSDTTQLKTDPYKCCTETKMR